LDIINCKLTSLPKLPSGLESLDVNLNSLSSLGKSRIYNVYEDGEHTADQEMRANESLQNVYLDIRYSTYGVMLEIAEELGNDFCCWKTDCIFFYDTQENRKKVQDIIESYGLECKIEYNKKLKPLTL
jgi:Leucine-rich repeat (LRR) protein